MIPIVLVGHVDHGKSTFIGRLLYDTKNLTEDRIRDIEEQAKETGKMEFAHVMDQFKEEREENITIDTSQVQLLLDGKEFLLVDAPGHKEFLKNMITGASQAQHAILMLDISEGIREQTEKHAQILHLLNIHHVAVMVNKMDKVKFKEEAFKNAEKEIQDLLSARGFANVVVIPISAYNGDNVAKPSQDMLWYSGPKALDWITSCEPILEKKESVEFLFPVQLVHEGYALGRLEKGGMKAGDQVTLFPGGQAIKVKGIHKYKEKLKTAEAGESIALDLGKEEQVRRGSILCSSAEQARPATKIKTQSFWASTKAAKVGDEVTLSCRTQTAKATIADISDILDAKAAPGIQPGEVVQVTFDVKGEILLFDKDQDESFSRVVYFQGGRASGCGVISHVAH